VIKSLKWSDLSATGSGRDTARAIGICRDCAVPLPTLARKTGVPLDAIKRVASGRANHSDCLRVQQIGTNTESSNGLLRKIPSFPKGTPRSTLWSFCDRKKVGARALSRLSGKSLESCRRLLERSRDPSENIDFDMAALLRSHMNV
jgi:hypothetical protein